MYTINSHFGKRMIAWVIAIGKVARVIIRGRTWKTRWIRGEESAASPRGEDGNSIIGHVRRICHAGKKVGKRSRHTLQRSLVRGATELSQSRDIPGRVEAFFEARVAALAAQNSLAGERTRARHVMTIIIRVYCLMKAERIGPANSYFASRYGRCDARDTRTML